MMTRLLLNVLETSFESPSSIRMPENPAASKGTSDNRPFKERKSLSKMTLSRVESS